MLVERREIARFLNEEMYERNRITFHVKRDK